MYYNTIYGDEIPNIPFREKPADCKMPVWRYDGNPIIDRYPNENIARIFNSAVLPFENGFIGVFRGEQMDGIPYLYLGRSTDGIHFTFEEQSIVFTDENGNRVCSDWYYDPRLVKIDGMYYIVWCDSCHNCASIGLARTADFKTFTLMERATLPFNRNGVLFPRKVNGEYLMLTRPSDGGHTAFGDIYLSKSKDLVYWGKHRRVMTPTKEWWQITKIGAGATPIETSEGWLLLYHGVCGTCNGYVYSMGAAILDRDNPEIVKYRCGRHLLTPEKQYETVGFVPNVVFPCAALADAKTGKIAIYYGAADTYVGLAFSQIDELTAYIKKYSI